MRQITNKTYMPLEWLDSIVPKSERVFPSPYNDYPFYLSNINDTSKLVDFINKREVEANHIGIISAKDGVVAPKNNTTIRNTLTIEGDEKFLSDYNDIFIEEKGKIERFFNVNIISSGKPQILLYYKGCFYIRHSDNCSEILKDGELAGFRCVAPHRKLTTVMFLSSYADEPKGRFEFSGGELVFDFLYDEQQENIKLRPKMGDLVSFFSNPYFSHSVKEVKDGLRISVAQWHNLL